MLAVACHTCVNTSFWWWLWRTCACQLGEEWWWNGCFSFYVHRKSENNQKPLVTCIHCSMGAHAWNPPSGCKEMRLSSFPDWSRLKLKLGPLTACPSLTRTQILSPITNLPKCSCLSQKRQTPESSVDPAFGFQTKPFSCLPFFF